VTWSGIAGYAAYDWTDKFRAAPRIEFFDDPQSVRTAARAPGNRTSLWETTATVQYKIWKGLVGRLEYRHDQANEKVFKIQSAGPTARNQDTISIDLYYLFF
jgi:putative OmpL-like beta-barrel porin-2